MNKHNIIVEKGVELKKRTMVHLNVNLTNTESLILNLILKNEEKESIFEFDDCFSPSSIPYDLTIRLKHLLLHDGETRNKFIGVVTARKLIKICKIHIMNDFPYVIFRIEISNFESKVRIHESEILSYLKIIDLDIDEKTN